MVAVEGAATIPSNESGKAETERPEPVLRRAGPERKASEPEGNPVESTDRYVLSDRNLTEQDAGPRREGTLDFAKYEDRIPDLTPRLVELPTGASVSHAPGETLVSRLTSQAMRVSS